MKNSAKAKIWLKALTAYRKINGNCKEIFNEFQSFVIESLLDQYGDLSNLQAQKSLLRMYIDIYNGLIAESQYLIMGKTFISYQKEEVLLHKLCEKVNKEVSTNFVCGNWLNEFGDKVKKHFKSKECYRGTVERNTIESKVLEAEQLWKEPESWQNYLKQASKRLVEKFKLKTVTRINSEVGIDWLVSIEDAKNNFTQEGSNRFPTIKFESRDQIYRLLSAYYRKPAAVIAKPTGSNTTVSSKSSDNSKHQRENESIISSRDATSSINSSHETSTISKLTTSSNSINSAMKVKGVMKVNMKKKCFRS